MFRDETPVAAPARGCLWRVELRRKEFGRSRHRNNIRLSVRLDSCSRNMSTMKICDPLCQSHALYAPSGRLEPVTETLS